MPSGVLAQLRRGTPTHSLKVPHARQKRNKMLRATGKIRCLADVNREKRRLGAKFTGG
jgi:hypothetical protein